MGKRKKTPQWIHDYGWFLIPFVGLVVLLTVIITLAALFPDGSQQREQSVIQVDTKSGTAPRERLITLKDDRKVLCLEWDRSFSCDWENAK